MIHTRLDGLEDFLLRVELRQWCGVYKAKGRKGEAYTRNDPERTLELRSLKVDTVARLRVWWWVNELEAALLAVF